MVAWPAWMASKRLSFRCPSASLADFPLDLRPCKPPILSWVPPGQSAHPELCLPPHLQLITAITKHTHVEPQPFCIKTPRTLANSCLINTLACQRSAHNPHRCAGREIFPCCNPVLTPPSRGVLRSRARDAPSPSPWGITLRCARCSFPSAAL